MSWWRPSYAWASCRGKYGAKEDWEALYKAATEGDIACINALLDKYPSVIVLNDKPDQVSVHRRGDDQEVHICYDKLCIVMVLMETNPAEEEEKIAEGEAARAGERYVVLRVYALNNAEVVTKRAT
jgi:hypothetical protein